METHSKYFFKDNPQDRLPKKSDLIIITDNFSTPENIGSVIRLLANVGAEKILVVGSLECRQSKIKKTAGAAYGHVTVEYCDYDNLLQHVPDGYQLMALETATGAENMYETHLPEKMALILGNEKFGVSQELLSKSNKTIYIPMSGAIKSMNVTHAASVCVFEWVRQRLPVGR